jgi:hypothetical protein
LTKSTHREVDVVELAGVEIGDLGLAEGAVDHMRNAMRPVEGIFIAKRENWSGCR